MTGVQTCALPISSDSPGSPVLPPPSGGTTVIPDSPVSAAPNALDVCPCPAQDQPQSHNHDGAHDSSDEGDDQVYTRETQQEVAARRARKRERNLELGEHTLDKVLGDVNNRVTTRLQLASFSTHHAFVSYIEPRKVYEALEDHDWIDAMHEELNNFKRNKVWKLVPRPKVCN